MAKKVTKKRSPASRARPETARMREAMNPKLLERSTSSPVKSMTVVYAAGTWDMFHVGHLNLLRSAKALGNILIVGVSTDELVYKYKKHHPLLSYEDRAAVVAACRCVDAVVPQRTLEKDEQLAKLDVDILVVGDDWWDRKVRGHDYMVATGRRVVYFPYTSGRSSSRLRKALDRYYHEQIEMNQEAEKSKLKPTKARRKSAGRTANRKS